MQAKTTRGDIRRAGKLQAATQLSLLQDRLRKSLLKTILLSRLLKEEKAKLPKLGTAFQHWKNSCQTAVYSRSQLPCPVITVMQAKTKRGDTRRAGKLQAAAQLSHMQDRLRKSLLKNILPSRLSKEEKAHLPELGTAFQHWKKSCQTAVYSISQLPCPVIIVCLVRCSNLRNEKIKQM